MKNYNVASAVTVSEERGAISGNQWLPYFRYGKKRSAATGAAVSTVKGVDLNSDQHLDADRETYTKRTTRLNIE